MAEDQLTGIMAETRPFIHVNYCARTRGGEEVESPASHRVQSFIHSFGQWYVRGVGEYFVRPTGTFRWLFTIGQSRTTYPMVLSAAANKQ